MECVLEKEPYHHSSPPPPPTPQSVVSVQMFVTQEINTNRGGPFIQRLVWSVEASVPRYSDSDRHTSLAG